VALVDGWIATALISSMTLAALIAGSVFGDVHSTAVRPRIIVWAAALTFLLFGVVATRRLARSLDRTVSRRTVAAAGAAVRLLMCGVGYILVIFGVLGVLDVSIAHLLVGAGIASVVIGIGAQQSLGNSFAAVVLLLARPFVVGDRVRVRSGALGGIFDATVLGMSLTYVTMRTDDGILKVPNSTLLAAGVGVLSPDDEHPAPLTFRASRKRTSAAGSQARARSKEKTRVARTVRHPAAPSMRTKLLAHRARDPTVEVD
jgi:small-conductance mechanosensitive channel